jgi:hypothetical protein
MILNERILEIERGSNRSHSVEYTLRTVCVCGGGGGFVDDLGVDVKVKKFIMGEFRFFWR